MKFLKKKIITHKVLSKKNEFYYAFLSFSSVCALASGGENSNNSGVVGWNDEECLSLFLVL